MPKKEYRDYDDKNIVVPGVECVRDGDRAILVVIDGTEHWIPQSQIHGDSDVWKRGDKGKLIITKWIGAKRGLCEEEED
jgi:hypothetical protein